MILILTNDGDLSSDIVIDWLDYFNYSYLRINSNEFLSKKFIFDKDSFLFDNQKYYVSDFRAIWFRKFGFFTSSSFYKGLSIIADDLSIKHLTKEFNAFLLAFMSIFNNKNWLTNPFNASINKFQLLQIASDYGIKVPVSYLTNSKAYLKFLNNKSMLISKSILDTLILPDKSHYYVQYTDTIDEDLISKLPDLFFPSYIQNLIKKDYEVRVFYLLGKLYSMAIFSQNDDQTKVDFRKYNSEKSNRNIPYKLPNEIEEKICKLMEHLNLNCASLDLIKDVNSEYILLEINVTGQFGMVDFPCNYGLHKKVAETLIKLDSNC